MTTPSNPIPCHEFGAELKEGSSFCPSCGEERIVTPCRNCQSGLNPGDSFCQECGQVVFADENLEAAVHEALKKPEGSLTERDIRKLTSLDASQREMDNKCPACIRKLSIS